MTYTPGPWNYAGPSDIGRDTYSIYGNGPLAYTAGPSDYGDAAEANARLIAAAPDLLGKLKALLEIMEDDHYKCDLHSDEDCDLTTEGGWHVKHHEMRLAKQAIDKATGQEQDRTTCCPECATGSNLNETGTRCWNCEPEEVGA